MTTISESAYVSELVADTLVVKRLARDGEVAWRKINPTVRGFFVAAGGAPVSEATVNLQYAYRWQMEDCVMCAYAVEVVPAVGFSLSIGTTYRIEIDAPETVPGFVGTKANHPNGSGCIFRPIVNTADQCMVLVTQSVDAPATQVAAVFTPTTVINATTNDMRGIFFFSYPKLTNLKE